MKLFLDIMPHNWTYIQENFIEWSFTPYITALGFLFWPIIFTAVIGYIYVKNQSVVVAAVAILIIFAALGNVLANVEGWVSAMQIFTALAMAGLITYFMTKLRR